MSVQIKKVLVADAVDRACVDLLKQNSIEVDCKYKLTKEQLVKEIVVSCIVVIISETSRSNLFFLVSLHMNYNNYSVLKMDLRYPETKIK